MQLLDGSRLLSILTSKYGLALSSLLLGILNSCGLAPVQMWPLTVIAYVFFMMIMSICKSKKQVFWLTLIFFASYGTDSLSWLRFVMEGFGEIPVYISTTALVLLSIFYIALPYAILNTIAFKIANGKKAVYLCCFMPLAFILGDFFTGWFLTGLPWIYSGYSCVEGPLKNYASIIGVRGITALIYLLSAVLALTALRRFLFLPIAALILVIGIFLEGNTQVTRLSPINVSMVQGNIEQSVRNNGRSVNDILGTYWSLSKNRIGADNLIIWPESALPFSLQMGQEVVNDIDMAFKQGGSSLVTGIFSTKPNQIYNSIISIGKDTDISTLVPYNKRILVPFGEVLPFAELLRPLGSIFVIPNSSFNYGDENQEPIKAAGLLFTPAICYEAIFPELISKLDNDKTNAIMMLSNDSWFGPTKAPVQHLNIARMRSMELQKPMLRDTNSGITTYIDEHGNLEKTLPTDVADVLSFEFYPVKGQTIYSKFGNTGLYIIMLILLLSGCYGLFRKDDEVREQLNKLIRP